MTFVPRDIKNMHCDCLQPGCPYCDCDGLITKAYEKLMEEITAKYKEKEEEKPKQNPDN